MQKLLRSSYILIVFCFSLVSCKHKQKEPAKKQKVASMKHTKNKNLVKSTSSNKASDIQKKLGISTKEIKESKLYSFIDDWYAVPYKYGGCLKSGVDCSCFTSILTETVYHKTMSRSTGEMYNECEKISLEEAKEGDLVFFKINGNSISHVGVYLRNKYFVHSSSSKGVIINNLDEAYYKKYFFCAGRAKKR